MTDATVQAEAAAWVARLDGHAPAPRERAEFDDWIKSSPSHAAAYDDALKTWRDLAAMGRSEQYRRLLETPTFRERMVSALRVPLRVRNWAVAATGAAAVAAVAWLTITRDVNSIFHQPEQVATQVAEVRELTLPDGSHVTLGAQSRLDFVFTQNARRAIIVGGDAFFTVTKNPARPFYVSIGDVQVKVVGTQFEVRRRVDEVSVAVVEGVVEVSRRDLDSGEVLQLHPGEALIASHGAASAVRGVDSGDVGAWRSGRLVYDNVELRDVVADINRYTPTRIVIEDPDLASVHVTSSFRATQVDSMLETLQSALPLEVDRRDNGDILLRPRR